MNGSNSGSNPAIYNEFKNTSNQTGENLKDRDTAF